MAPVRRLDRAELECRYNVHGVDAAFRTEERAVDPSRMAEVLRDALVAHPAIECCWSTRIDAVEERSNSKYWVRCDQDYPQGPFDNVVNALWGDRLRIDETVGVRVSRPYLFRQKVANRIRLKNSPEAWRSVTMVIGPFGDFVALPNRSCYLSWYPTGCIRRTNELAPPPAWEHTPQDQLRAIYNDCVVALSRRINGLDRLVGHAVETRSDPGVIFCWGDTDVEDPQSELHLRHEIGVSNPRPGYYSIDTGKLTTAPIFAEQVATMIGPK